MGDYWILKFGEYLFYRHKSWQNVYVQKRFSSQQCYIELLSSNLTDPLQRPTLKRIKFNGYIINV